MKDSEKDLEQRIKNTADLLAQFVDENLSEEQAKEIKDILPTFDEKDK